MLASAIFGFMVLALFEGVIVATRIAHENAELLAAEAVAWDATWKCFNESADDLKKSIAAGNEQSQWLNRKIEPQLYRYDTAPKLTMYFATNKTGQQLVGWSGDLIEIKADLEWGNSGRRRKLSDSREMPVVYRSTLGRAY